MADALDALLPPISASSSGFPSSAPPPLLNFSYVPLNHIDPADGSYKCTDDTGRPFGDCPSTTFDSCLVNTLCPFGRCDAPTQRRIAHFLRCFEGPFANRENPTNATRREPCMAAAFGGAAAYDAASACAGDASAAAAAEGAMNATRAAMYAKLGPNPGLFPHIFIDGKHQSNNSWTALVATLCRHPSFKDAPPCATVAVTLTFTIESAPFTKSALAGAAAAAAFAEAVGTAADFAISQGALPVNFPTPPDAPAPGNPGWPPSYVNVNAVRSARLGGGTRNGTVGVDGTVATAAGAGVGGGRRVLGASSLRVEVDLGILQAFAATALPSVSSVSVAGRAGGDGSDSSRAGDSGAGGCEGDCGGGALVSANMATYIKGAWTAAGFGKPTPLCRVVNLRAVRAVRKGEA